MKIMSFQKFLPSAKSPNWFKTGRCAFHIAKESLRYDRSRPRKAVHRMAKRLRQDKIRAFVLVGLMLLSWALIALVGQVIDLNPNSIYMLCIASGVVLNVVTSIEIFLEKRLPPTIHMTGRLCYVNPYCSDFSSRNLSPAAPPPRHVS